MSSEVGEVTKQPIRGMTWLGFRDVVKALLRRHNKSKYDDDIL